MPCWDATEYLITELIFAVTLGISIKNIILPELD